MRWRALSRLRSLEVISFDVEVVSVSVSEFECMGEFALRGGDLEVVFSRRWESGRDNLKLKSIPSSGAWPHIISSSS